MYKRGFCKAPPFPNLGEAHRRTNKCIRANRHIGSMTTADLVASRRRSPRGLMAALGYGGLLPFYASALWVCWPGLPHASAAATLFVTYGAVILAFLGGTLWGYAVKVPPPAKFLRLVISNIVALFAVSAALAPAVPAAVLLALGQVALLLYERSQAVNPGWYLGLRTRLVLGVLPAHAILVIGLMA